MTVHGDVIVALKTLVDASPGLGDATRSIGWPSNEIRDPGQYVMVAHNGNPGAPSDTSFERQWVDLAQTRAREIGLIGCATAVQSGDDDLAAIEPAAFSMFKTVADAIEADRTLGGVVMSCQIIGGGSVQHQAGGTAVVVPFTVAYVAED